MKNTFLKNIYDYITKLNTLTEKEKLSYLNYKFNYNFYTLI